MKKMLCLILAFLSLCAVLTGCGGKEATATTAPVQTTAPAATEPVIIWETGNGLETRYILGYWGEKMIRSNGHTYPYMFYNPLTQCGGFTLEYEIRNIASGDLKGNFRYEIYIHEVDGQWTSYQVVEMEDTALEMELKFDSPKDLDGVAVVCGKQGDVEFDFDIKVRDPF